jgi:uncharacterized protein (DUF952 family)
MAFRLIRGKFVVKGKQPDGDSVRFLPDNVGLLMSLRGPKPMLNPGESVQLRLEAIDALETHYNQGRSDLDQQPDRAAKPARAFLLDAVGITNVVWDDAERTVVSANDGTPGYILSRTFEQNRRPVAFVYAGASSDPDGASVFLDAQRLKASVNYQSLLAGHVYPTYYEGVFASLRPTLDEATTLARKASAHDSVWAIDRTRSGLAIPPFENLTTNFALLPKLFRRLSQFYKTHSNLEDFKAFLEADPDPCIFLPDADPTSLHRFVEVVGGKVRLTVDPEQLMFREKIQLA